MKKLLSVLAVLVLGAIYYYISLPAINIHSVEFWYFIMMVVIASGAFYAWKKKILSISEIKESKVLKGFVGIFGLILAVYLIGSLLSSP